MENNNLHQEETHASFYMGVQDKFSIMGSDNIVVVGLLKGTVHVGDAVYISNLGDDDDNILLTSIEGIEIAPGKKVEEATDCNVGLCLSNCSKHNIKCGTVLFTRNISMNDVHNGYITALGEMYIAKKKLDLTPEEIEKLSITDCSEIWRLFLWYNSKVKMGDEAYIREKINNIAKALRDKILAADSIYCIYNIDTGEPHLFSKTVDNQDGTYTCTPPDIMLISKAYKNALSEYYPKDTYEIKEISNGDDKKGIENFLGTAFYLNGACGVAVNNNQVAIDAQMLVPEPDYSDIIEIQRPVTNPDLVRWLLLMAQLGEPNTKDKETIYKLYYSFMQRELVKAKFLVPMKHEGEIPASDEKGKTVLKEGVTMNLAVMEGKNGRQAIRMYTDWKRLFAGMGEGWEGLLQTIDGMIDVFDCAINVTEYVKAGCYISKDMFESIKK